MNARALRWRTMVNVGTSRLPRMLTASTCNYSHEIGLKQREFHSFKSDFLSPCQTILAFTSAGDNGGSDDNCNSWHMWIICTSQLTTTSTPTGVASKIHVHLVNGHATAKTPHALVQRRSLTCCDSICRSNAYARSWGYRQPLAHA